MTRAEGGGRVSVEGAVERRLFEHAPDHAQEFDEDEGDECANADKAEGEQQDQEDQWEHGGFSG